MDDKVSLVISFVCSPNKMWLLNGNNECLDISLDVKKWQYVSKLLKTLPINSEEMSYVRTCKKHKSLINENIAKHFLRFLLQIANPPDVRRQFCKKHSEKEGTNGIKK